MAFAVGEDLGVGPFPQEDAKDFYYSGLVPQPIDSSDEGLPAFDKAEHLPYFPRHLLQALLLLRLHHLNTLHPDPLGWVPRDVLFECVLSWWFFGRRLSCNADSCRYRACRLYVYGGALPGSKSLRNIFRSP